jgi:hypothetical protein
VGARAERAQWDCARYQDRKWRLPPGSGFLAILAAHRAYRLSWARLSVYGAWRRQPRTRARTIARTAGGSASSATPRAMATINPIVETGLVRVGARAGGAQDRLVRPVGGPSGPVLRRHGHGVRRPVVRCSPID